MKKLTKEQKKLIIRLQIGSILAQCSDSMFDVDLDGITEEERQELYDGVVNFGWARLFDCNATYAFPSAEEVIKYVRELNTK